MVLFSCERLSARISKVQCERNRKGGVFACDKCPGLGAGSVVDVDLLVREKKSLGVDMGTKGKLCDVDGCTAMDWRGGKCWKHHPTNVAKREAKAATVAPIQPEAVADCDAARSVTPDPRVTFECPHCQCALNSAEVESLSCPVCGEALHTHVDQAGFVSTPGVSDGDTVPVDADPVILLALREAWQAKEAEWLVELSGLKAGSAVCRAAAMVQAVEGLGY